MNERSHLCESHEEEVANAVSHGIGAILSAVALGGMICLALPLSVWHVVGVSIFGSSLVLLYLCSAVYHSVTRHHYKRLFQILDHSFIFVLIAGSYTPWLLVNLRGPWGWSLFGVVWALALSGVVMKTILLPRFEKAGTFIYVAMGWLICVAIQPLIENVSLSGLIWLIAGGVCYTVGVAFFVMKKVRFAHFTWHLFVMGGSLCHVVAVILGVLEPGDPARS
jgi:hemolysin III